MQSSLRFASARTANAAPYPGSGCPGAAAPGPISNVTTLARGQLWNAPYEHQLAGFDNASYRQLRRDDGGRGNGPPRG